MRFPASGGGLTAEARRARRERGRDWNHRWTQIDADRDGWAAKMGERKRESGPAVTVHGRGGSGRELVAAPGRRGRWDEFGGLRRHAPTHLRSEATWPPSGGISPGVAQIGAKQI